MKAYARCPWLSGRVYVGRCDVMTTVGADLTAGGRSVQDLRGLTFRFLVAIDVEGFSHLHTAGQARAQDDLECAMRQAAADAGLDLKRWYRQPRGDGELAILPGGADGLSLVADYPGNLASAVAAVNRTGKAGPRLRARMAIHHGAVAPGRFGPVGVAPVVVSRLVDAEIVRQQLRERSDLDIALIVSAAVYNEVIQSRLNGLRPESFRRTVIRAKGITYVGYLRRDVLVPRARTVPELQRLSIDARNFRPRQTASPPQEREISLIASDVATSTAARKR